MTAESKPLTAEREEALRHAKQAYAHPRTVLAPERIERPPEHRCGVSGDGLNYLTWHENAPRWAKKYGQTRCPDCGCYRWPDPTPEE